jgi:hypothetical protein
MLDSGGGSLGPPNTNASASIPAMIAIGTRMASRTVRTVPATLPEENLLGFGRKRRGAWR